MKKKYSIDLLTVYIREAHPKDKWRWSGDSVSCSIRDPRTTDERLQIARQFAEEYSINPDEIVIDTLNNNMEKLYKGWPERLYVIHNSKIVYAGAPGPFGYIPEEVDRFLQK